MRSAQGILGLALALLLVAPLSQTSAREARLASFGRTYLMAAIGVAAMGCSPVTTGGQPSQSAVGTPAATQSPVSTSLRAWQAVWPGANARVLDPDHLPGGRGFI